MPDIVNPTTDDLSGDDGDVHWVIADDTLTLFLKAEHEGTQMKDYSVSSRLAWESSSQWANVKKSRNKRTYFYRRLCILLLSFS